jgi:hypothetical protein
VDVYRAHRGVFTVVYVAPLALVIAIVVEVLVHAVIEGAPV